MNCKFKRCGYYEIFSEKKLNTKTFNKKIILTNILESLALIYSIRKTM